MNNPLQLIQVMQNPQQFIQNMMQNSQAMQNPIMQNAMKMYQSGDRKGLESLVNNVAKEQGTTVQDMMKKLGIQ